MFVSGRPILHDFLQNYYNYCSILLAFVANLTNLMFLKSKENLFRERMLRVSSDALLQESSNCLHFTDPVEFQFVNFENTVLY